jgi:TRAP-type C4-dicarboxylate transport system permease small subunit
MSILKWLDDNFEEFLMVTFLILMTIIMGIQVCARYIFNYSLSWSEEVTRYLFIWTAFISVSYCTKECISIKIEQVTILMSNRGKALVKLINHTIEIVFFLYLIPFAVMYLKSSIESGQLSPVCKIPMYFIQAAPLFSFSIVALRIAQRWAIECKTVRKG